MRTTITLIFGFFIGVILPIKAQLSEPVHWTFKSEKLNATTYKVIFTAQIDEGWYVYSQDILGNGPVPLRINFTTNPSVQIEGQPIELGYKKEIFDQNFNMMVTKLLGQMTYEQIVKVTEPHTQSMNKTDLTVRGQLSYMTCNNEICLPPKKVSFNISLNP